MSLALEGNGSDRLGDAFYPLYRLLFGEDSQFAAEFQTTLKRARMGDTVEHYLSRALAYGVFAGGGLWLIGTLLGYVLFATGLVSVGTLIGVPISNERLLELVIAARIPSLIDQQGPGGFKPDYRRPHDRGTGQREPGRHRSRTEVQDANAGRDHPDDLPHPARGDGDPQDPVPRRDGRTRRGAETASAGGGPSFVGGIDTGLLSLLFFHAVTMQAILSGLISGYMRDADILSGVKYVVILMTIALGVWMVVG